MFNSWEVLSIPSGPQGVEATVQHMAVLVRDAQTDVVVRTTALGLLNRTPVQTARAGIGLVRRFVQWNLKLINEPVELLQPPNWLLSQWEQGIPIWGDCDDAAMLVASLLVALGLQVRLKAVWPIDYGDGHVFAEAWDGLKWAIADPTTDQSPPQSWNSKIVDI